MNPAKSVWTLLLTATLGLTLWSASAHGQTVNSESNNAATASSPGEGNANSGNDKDPFESFNRPMFEFNDALDRALFKPVAQGYKAVLPEPARNCVSNAFSNVGDIWIAFNNLLQGKPVDAISDVCRVVVNSTVGLLGCFDVASEIGLVKHNEDLGQTFGRWGIGSGPYLVLPIFGPSTVRDSFGLAGDVYANPIAHIEHVPTRNTLLAVSFVDKRASLLSASDLLEKVALDRYTFVRDGYLQRRRSLIHDGNPPEQSRQTPESSLAKTADNHALVTIELEPGKQAGVPIGWFDPPTQRDALPQSKPSVAAEPSVGTAL